MNRYTERRLQDDVEEFIKHHLELGYSSDEIIQMIPEAFEGFDIGLASDAYEDYERDNDLANEEATIGDIEQFIDNLETEGFPTGEALAMASKRYGLSTREIMNMLESTGHSRALKYLNQLEESLEQFSDTFYPEEEDWDAELRGMGFDEEQVAYFQRAEELAEEGYTSEQIQEELGYGVIDSAVLRDTFDD